MYAGMDTYTIADAAAVALRAITDPGFLIGLPCTIAAFALPFWATPPPEPTWLTKKVEACRVETHHLVDRKPTATIRRVLPRVPGLLYPEQTCRCGLHQRVRVIGTAGSAKAQRLRNQGLL